MRRSLIRSLFLLALALLPRGASADRVDRLIHILRSSGSYKVRLRTVITLGRLRDGRVAPALTRALGDRHHLVRGVAARMLARQGAVQSLAAVQRMARRDRSHSARRMARRALRKLRRLARRQAQHRARPAPRASQRGSPRGGYLAVGRLANRSGHGGRRAVAHLARGLREAFASVGGLTLQAEGQPQLSPAVLRRRGLLGMELLGSIRRLSLQVHGREHQVSCTVEIQLATLPGHSIKAVYSGSSSLSESTRRSGAKFRDSLVRDVLAGAAQAARDHIVRSYLGRRRNL